MTSEPPPKPGAALRRYSPPVLVGVVVLHLIFGGVAAVWVVSKYSAARKLTFNAGPKSPNPSERALEHRVQLQKKMDSTSAPPLVPRRVLSTGAAKITLPPLPEMKAQENAPPTMMSAGSGAAFGSQSAASLGGGGGGNGSAINFFGIRDVSTSVVIMIDVSDSMFSRTGDAKGSKLVRQGTEQNFQVVRDEAIKLVQSLTPQTRFGIVRWAGGAYPWRPELMPATEENKQGAIAHIQGEVDFKSAKKRADKPGGTRHDYALAEAFSLKPETIYMLTDGNATAAEPGGGMKAIPAQEIYRVAEAGQKALPKKAHLHVIYYLNSKEKSEEVDMLRGLASRNSGKFQKVKAKGQRE